jgi:methylated-DNA-[protein]-cysteine S-methyltransferase
MFDARIRVPFCTLGLRFDADAIDEIVFLPLASQPWLPPSALGLAANRQLLAYVENPRFAFELPLTPRGTAFQRRVWQCISAIPCGQTRTYGDIARELGSSPRAVGQACGENPFPLVVPCHRVVAASGLGGFAHHDEGVTLGVKRWLLAHEAGTRALLV